MKKLFTKEKLPKICLTLGLLLLISGFVVLLKVDRMAKNFAGFAAPLLILCGWIVIGIGFWKAEKQ